MNKANIIKKIIVGIAAVGVTFGLFGFLQVLTQSPEQALSCPLSLAACVWGIGISIILEFIFGLIYLYI